ncbi:MAG: ABC transporter ATP-binding protein [Candidatus Magasanikbacteria bacterium]
MTLKTKALTKTFGGNTAVDNLSVEITPQTITGLIGPNGSGKTTLVNLLTGIKNIDEGSVIISETELDHINPYDTPTYGITRTFQQVRMFEQMSVLDNVLVALTERGVFSSLFETHSDYHLNQAQNILETVELWDKRNDSAENLSYGQRKLLEIARALAMDVNLIFFDEPFAGLFPQIQEIVSEVLKELKEDGKTVVLIEHDMDVIRDLCDQVIVLDAGNLLSHGTPEEVLNQQKVQQAYLGK